MSKSKRGLHELYAKDPIEADELVWGRKSDPVTRRGFLKGSGLAAMSAAVGASIPLAHLMPGGLIPAALAQTPEPFVIPGKEGLVVLNDRPINAETPAHLLDDDVTPGKHLFVRNNGRPPAMPNIDPATWTLEIGGESALSTKSFTIEELKERFRHHTYQLQLECGGNGRSEFVPPASGNQWSTGAVGCPEWTGVRLKDVLEDVGLKDDAVYVAYYGADTHASGDTSKAPISRGVPVAKALEKESLIAWAMNGEDIPHMNGHPLRLVIGGWPGSVCGKWLNRIVVRNQVHDGPKMTGTSYRVPCSPVAPGSEVPDEDMCIIESMPVKSLITYPKSGIEHAVGEAMALRGHAWAGDREVRAMHVSTDFGATWIKARPDKPVTRLALVLGGAAFAESVELDAFTGLKKTGDWELVRNNCIACHSTKLITQQSGDAAQWLGMIRWMQKKQNLWQFDPETEQRIVTYLAENYPPEENRRRAALPADQMPPNPYAPRDATD